MKNIQTETPTSFFEVNFSPQSMGELNKLSKHKQLLLIDQMSKLSPAVLTNPTKAYGVINRNGKNLYRFRTDDYRIYFEIINTALYSHYILLPHTWTDFVVRFKLPIREEIMIENDQSFWKYLENLKR